MQPVLLLKCIISLKNHPLHDIINIKFNIRVKGLYRIKEGVFMKMGYGKEKRRICLFLALLLFLGTGSGTAKNIWAAQTKQARSPDQDVIAGQAAITDPAVITLYTLGGTISSAVEAEEPDSRAWCQTDTGVYKRVLNSYQRLPNAIAPCYSDGVEFAGWYDSMEYTNRVEDVFVEGGSVTLYAKWVFKDITGQNENMWYQYQHNDDQTPPNHVVDIQGLEGTKKIRTTFGDLGYGYYYKIGEPASYLESSINDITLNLPAKTDESIFHKASEGYNIYVASLVTLDGTYATMHYIVVNTGNEDVENFSLGYAADIMIGNDDSALVTTGQNEQGSNTYIQMQEKNTGKMFRLYVKGTSYGITDVDRFWIGLWQGGGYRKHAFDDMHDPTTGGDSAFSCSWVDRTIPANSSTIYSVKLGVGELSEMGGTSNTVTLDANGGAFRDGSEISNHSGNSIPVASLETPTRLGYKFDGWYLARDGGTKQTGNITQSITLYAHWKEALYGLENDTVVQADTNQTVPKETADITISLGDERIGRGEFVHEIIRTGEELALSMDVTEGYYLPKSIYVDIRGVDGTTHLTEGTGYQYELNSDRTHAQITVSPEYITGDVVVTTIGHPVPAERPQSVEAMVEGEAHSTEITLTDPPPVLEAISMPEELPDHTYEYQWYENSQASNQNGGKIPGAAGRTYTFPSSRSLGDYYFYCTVTSKRNNGQIANLTSNYVKVRVKKATRTVILADKETVVTGTPISIDEAEIIPGVTDPSQIRYVYYVDKDCTKQTTLDGSGALTAGGAPSEKGTYYVKAYVLEDEIYEAAQNTPPAKLTIKPQEHKVSIRVRLDSKDWENHGRIFALQDAGGHTISELSKVPPGNYSIYDMTEETPAGGTDTGVRVTVGDEDIEAVIDYYTVTFYSEGAAYGADSPQKPQIILSGKNAVDPGEPAERPGYAFEGWMTQPQGGTRYLFADPVDKKTDVFAKWSLSNLKYRIEHYLQSGSGDYTLQETEELHGTIGEEKYAVAKDYSGYREDTQHKDRIPQGTVAADGSLVLKLYYRPIEYQINYGLDGGHLPEGMANPAVYTVLSADITLVAPEKEGYAFTGWTQPGEGAPHREIIIPSGSTGDRSFEANWEIQKFPYQTEHYLQDASGGYRLEETEYLIGTFGEEQIAAAKEYVGYRENTQNKNRIPSGNVAADGSLVLRLYYDLTEYHIGYELDGGSLPKGKKNPVSYTVMSDDIVLVNPVKPGYAFIGWTMPDNDAPQATAIIRSGSTGDREFTANWETVELPYRVEHYLQADGGGIFALKETEQLTGIIGEQKNAVAKEFTGYLENEMNPGRIPSGIVTVDHMLTLRLYYAPVEYSIQYDLDGGYLPGGKENPVRYTVQSGDITLVNPVKSGYIFSGWKVPGRTILSENAIIPAGSTGSLSFTATWIPDTQTPYWVEHYKENPSGDGYSLADRELFTGATGEIALAKAKEYDGFTENTACIGRIESGKITAAAPLVLRLYYDRQTYVITFIVDTSKADVHGKTIQILRYGQAIAKPFVLPKEGYVLSPLYDGWDREVSANAQGNAAYTAQLVKDNTGGKALEEAEQVIIETNTDKTDPKDSKFYPLMLRAYGQEKSIKLKWRKIKGADGYILYGSRCGSDMKRIRTIKNGNTASCTVKNLKSGTYYKYLIVAYKNVNGKKRVTHSSQSAHSVTNGGKYGNPANISCKPSALTLKKGKSKALEPAYRETKKVKTHIAKFRFYSDNPKVAAVTKKGKVTAKLAGDCNIYVYAQNGFYKKVRVKVER